jgi:hypothetical protein
VKIDDLFKHEGYEATDSMDCIIIEESYAKMARLIDEVMDLYNNVENLIEHDMAMKEESRKYSWMF